MPQVSDAECASVRTAMSRKPAESKQLDALRDKMRDPNVDRAALRDEQQKLYTSIGVDARIAGACRMRDARGASAGMPPNAAPQNPITRDANGGDQPQLQLGNTERSGIGRQIRPGLVFVAKGRTYEPRAVMLGAGNFDYTEIVSGLEEGEEVALLASLSLQAQRQQQTDRFRQNMGGGVPGMTQGGGRGPGGR